MTLRMSVLITCLLVSTAAKADNMSLEVGGLTVHTSVDESSSGLKRKVSGDGRFVFNRVLSAKYTQELSDGNYLSYRLLMGENCMGGFISGGAFAYGTSFLNGWVDAAILLGAYKQDDSLFTDAGIKPFSLFNSGVVPLLGVDAGVKVYEINKSTSIHFNTLFTPILSFSSLELRIRL